MQDKNINQENIEAIMQILTRVKKMVSEINILALRIRIASETNYDDTKKVMDTVIKSLNDIAIEAKEYVTYIKNIQN